MNRAPFQLFDRRGTKARLLGLGTHPPTKGGKR